MSPSFLASGALGGVLAALVASADTGADFGRLLASRDALVAALEKRPAAQEVLLRLDEAADRDDAWVTLRRADGAWRAAFAEVPGWHQATMKDWRGYYHANFTHGCWRPNLRFEANAAALTLDAGRLAGALEVAYRRDRPFAQRQPPNEYVQWWDKFIAGGHTVPRPVRYALDLEARPDAVLLDLILEDGVYWDAAFAPNPKNPNPPSAVSRRPIHLRLQAPATRFTVATAKTPSWVGGFHEADASRLKFADGRLTGPLVVYLHQDGWMPWGRGKHTQHEPVTVAFEVDARLDRNDLTGRYTASFGGEIKGRHYNPRGDDSESVTLPETRYEGAIRGRGGKLVIGRYTATGAFEEQAGAVDGMLLDAPRPARERLALPDGGVTVERIGALLHQIRALHLALQHAPLSLEEALRQTDRPAPTATDADACLDRAMRLVAALPPPDAEPPAARPETVGDSPSFGSQPAPADTNGVHALPADAAGWWFLPRWRVLGGFEQRAGLEHDSALAPDLVVLPDAAYVQPRDRFGTAYAHVSTQRWQSVTCEDPRLGAPWERPNMFPRYVGQVWYGAATLRSERARTVWLSLEANDFAKLWVNDRLVWRDGERDWRYRPMGRAFVPVPLEPGENRFLVRVHGDRQLGWLRLALTPREPATPHMPAAPARAASPFVFPDARPPLAWDIAGGTNVAWRIPELAGETRPLPLGDAVFVTAGTGTLSCVEAATGKVRWSRALAAAQPAPRERGGLPPAGAPVTDGQRIAFVAGDRTLGCFGAAGEPLWSQPLALGRPRLWVQGERLIVEGQAEQPRGGSSTVRMLALSMADGKEHWRRDLPGGMNSRGQTLAAGGVAALLSCTGAWLDPATGEPLPALDCETQTTDRESRAVRAATAEPYRPHSFGDMFYLTSQARNVAMRLWARDGRLGFAHVWESNYGSSGFANVGAPGTGTERYLFSWHSSLAHTPHAPDPRAEINAYDTRTGRWLARVKPVMDDLYSYGPLNLAPPVVAGPYLFLLGGRSNNSRNQIAIVTADERLLPVIRQDVEPGTVQPPVFVGDHMVLRSGRSLLGVAAATPEGRRYERLALARAALRTVGPEPLAAQSAEPARLERVSARGDVPVGKLASERPTERWLGAGPFPADGLKDSAALAALRPQAGAAFAGKPFEPLDRQHAFNEPPAYLRTGELQGTGDITPRFSSRVDPSGVSSPTHAGLLYTVLDNPRDRLVLPAMKRPGVTQWLGGRELDSDQPLRLAPGLYPYLVRVEPEFYRVEPKEILPPLNVTNALARGALRDIGWPKAWHVLGPLPCGAAPLKPAQLRDVPATLSVEGIACPLTPLPVQGYVLDLACVTQGELGKPLNPTAHFVRPGAPVAAYAFAAIECPEDGYLYVSTSGEASLCWYLDGEVAHDRLHGLWTSPTDVSGHPFAVRVTRGRHVLAVQVRPGAGGWSLCSAGGFSEKRGDQMPEFRVESKIVIPPPDFRLQPCFRDLPHPPTLHGLWAERVRAHADRLMAVVAELPGTPEAQRAAAMLAHAQAESRTLRPGQ